MNRALHVYREYPRSFWMMILVNFVDRLGGLFAIFFVSSFIGAFPGGALTDRFGRMGIIIFSLLATCSAPC